MTNNFIASTLRGVSYIWLFISLMILLVLLVEALNNSFETLSFGLICLTASSVSTFILRALSEIIQILSDIRNRVLKN
jgi:tellurite resistance protein TehA-like permease